LCEESSEVELFVLAAIVVLVDFLLWRVVASLGFHFLPRLQVLGMGLRMVL